MQAETTIYSVVWWVLFEYSSFDHFPYLSCLTTVNHIPFIAAARNSTTSISIHDDGKLTTTAAATAVAANCSPAVVPSIHDTARRNEVWGYATTVTTVLWQYEYGTASYGAIKSHRTGSEDGKSNAEASSGLQCLSTATDAA